MDDFIKLKPISELPTETNPLDGQILFSDNDDLKKYPLNELKKTLTAGIVGTVSPTDATPTIEGGYKPTISGTYANCGGLIANANYDTAFFLKGGVWTKTETALPLGDSTIKDFSSTEIGLTYPSVRRYNNSTYRVISGKTSTANNPTVDTAIWESLSQNVSPEFDPTTTEKPQGGKQIENRIQQKLSETSNLANLINGFSLFAGSIVTTTGVPNTSVNWLYAEYNNIEQNTTYKLKGYGLDDNSKSRRVFYYNNSTFISYQASDTDEFIFQTPANCNRIRIQVASSTDVAADIPNSPYWQTLKLFKGTETNETTTLKAEKIKGTISTTQLLNIENSLNIEQEEFLNKFTFTSNVGGVKFKTISMLATTTTNHLNFTCTKEANLSSLSVKISSIDTTSSIRIGFGTATGGYLLVLPKTSTICEVYEMSNYGITAVSSFSYTSMTLNINDVVTLRRSGSMLALYVNGVLKGSSSLITKGFSELRTQGLIGFRDFTTKYEATQISTSKRSSPYMHISVDDTISLLRELTENNYTSIFENSRLAFYKQMHDKYGVCFSFYLFYQNTSNTYNLTQMPTTFKAEFIANSHWLKFGFHGVDSTTDYSTIDTTTMVENYNRIINQIIRFSSISNLDVIPRFSMFGGNTANLIELKKYGIKGLLTADDTREANAGLNTAEKNVVINSDDYYAYDRDLYYVRTEYRLDSATADSVVTQLNNLKNNIDNNNVYIMFYHEGKETTQAGKDMIEAMIKWAYDNRIRFDYAQNNIFK